MSSFYVEEVHAAAALFDRLASEECGLYHALLVSPHADAMGLSIDDINLKGSHFDVNARHHPKYQALLLVENALFKPIDSGGKYPLPTVLASNTVFLDDVLAYGDNSARSVLASFDPSRAQEYLNQLNATSRRAYRAIRGLLSDAPWNHIHEAFIPNERVRNDNVHIWLTGLELWADSHPNGLVACRRDFVKKSGTVTYALNGPYQTPPVSIVDNTMEKSSDPPHLWFGNCPVYAPSRQEVADELFHLTDNAVWFRIEMDLCVASAMALRWIVSELSSGNPRDESSSGMNTETQVDALTAAQRLTLLTLNEFDASIVSSVQRICDAMPPENRLSPDTVRHSVLKLIALGLAERPEGLRKGARLTIKGRRLSVKIAY